MGRTVRIYMADGSAFGIQQAEIFNRTVQALAVSRARIAELKDWPEASRAGVYFLFGVDEEDRPKVYLGEAQNILRRLSDHLAKKEFWKDVVMFVAKDENINSKYLEARLINLAYEGQRYEVDNQKVQNVPALSRADADAMDEIIQDIRLILGVMGTRYWNLLS